MTYTENISNFFKKNSRVSFKNDLETSVFYLVDRLLNIEAGNNYFIKVPMKELGPENYAENYSEFCGAIAFAAGVNVYDFNNNNSKPELKNGDFICNKKKQILIKRPDNCALKPSNLNQGIIEDEIVEISRPENYSRILNSEKFKYNSLNGQTLIDSYLEWVKIFNEAPRILNDIKRKILIISQAEIDKSVFTKAIPHCRIDENGNLNYSSPIEPLIYLARDENDTIKNLVQNKTFDTVIFIGDSKFKTIGIWSLRHKYFNNRIYIGFQPKDENSIEFYCYAPNEIFNFYGVQDEAIQLNKDDIHFSDELTGAIDGFVEKVKEIQENGGNFRFSLLGLINRTAPIASELKEKMEDWFDDYLINNLSNAQEGDFDQLADAYIGILKALELGNRNKIDKIADLVSQTKEKNKETLFFIASQKDEIDFLCRNFKIKKENIIMLRTFSSMLRSILNAKNFKNNKRNKFIFLAYDNTYHDLLKMMDAFTLLGERRFIGKKDKRFNAILKDRNKYFDELLAKENRETITGIKYELEIAHLVTAHEGASTLDDFEYDDEYEFIIQRDSKVENYQITLEGGNTITLNGSVFIEDAIEDVADLKVGDEFMYYQNDQQLFEEAWRSYEPELAIKIEEYSQIWKKTLEKLKIHFNNEIELLAKLKEYKWKTELTTLRAYLRESSQTQFPRSGSLTAIKKLCDSIEEFHNDAYLQNYDGIRKAQKALSMKIKLGRIICKALYDNKIGKESQEPIIKKLKETDLFEQLRINCLRSGVVLAIKKCK